MQFKVDKRLPLEAVIGWDASQNGNMAELLQEPSLMGATEGAAITVLSKGLQFPAGSDPFGVNPTAPACSAGTTPASKFPGSLLTHAISLPILPEQLHV